MSRIAITRCDREGCDGELFWLDSAGSIVKGGGCGEPCSWAMGKSGHGVPPFPACLDKGNVLAIDMLQRVYEAEFEYGAWPSREEIADTLAFARAMREVD